MATFTCLIQHAPTQGHHSYTAYKFCQAALQQGHQIAQVFFYGDGVAHGNAGAHVSSDEMDMQAMWRELSETFQFPLLICATVAARQGVVGAQELTTLPSGNLAHGYQLGGLAEYMETLAASDHLVQF